MHGVVSISTPRDFPEVDGGMCCAGAAARGPGFCTCWEPVYDLEQAEPDETREPMSRLTLCGDCAFRTDSPEMTGDEAFANAGPEYLGNIVHSDTRFACHKEMRQVLHYKHPSGAVHLIEPGKYDPPQRKGTVYKADGTPADNCAGLARARARLQRTGDWQ